MISLNILSFYRISALCLFVYCLLYVISCFSYQQIIVLEPLKGEYNGKKQNKILVFIGGGRSVPSNYVQLCHSIQQQTKEDLNLWIVIPQFFINMPNHIQMRSKLKQSIDKVKQKSDIFRSRNNNDIIEKDVIIIGYSVGGIAVRQIVQEDRYAALVLYASYLSRNSDSDLNHFRSPVLTVAGELDGFVRIPRIALQIQDFNEIADRSDIDYAVRRKPVVILPGVSHIQFGNNPNRNQDFLAEVSLDEAHELIVSTTADFLYTVWNCSSAEGAFASMHKRVEFSRELVSAYLTAIDSEHNWCAECQKSILDNSSNYTVKNEVIDNAIQFVYRSPKLNDNQITVYTQNVHRFNPMDFSSISTSLQVQKCKMIASSNPVTRLSICKELNQKALDLAERLVHRRILQRYKRIGKQIQLQDDYQKSNSITWMSSSLKMNSTGTVVSSSLTQLETQYCTLLPLSRIIEWMMIDSLPRSGTKRN
jgi:dienelactone hydrolase